MALEKTTEPKATGHSFNAGHIVNDTPTPGPMSVTTVNLLAARRDIDLQVTEHDGWLPDDLAALLDDVTAKMEAKAVAVARFAQCEDAHADVCDAEIARLQGRAKAMRERAKYNREVRLRALLDALGIDKLKTPLVTIAKQANPPSVLSSEWDEEGLRGMYQFAPQFVSRTPEKFTLDKKSVLAAHKAGQPIPEKVTVGNTDRIAIR